MKFLALFVLASLVLSDITPNSALDGTLEPKPLSDDVKKLFAGDKTVVVDQPPVADGAMPKPKEEFSLRQCELFGCQLVDGKIQISDFGSTSYNVTKDVEMPVVYDAPMTVGKTHPLIVQTEYGPVKGYYNHGLYRGKVHHIDVFRKNTPRGWLGIPFAQSPKKNRRFLPPQPYLKSKYWGPKVRHAHHPPKACPQTGFEATSDDCLYLNVFAPPKERMEKLNGKKLPVFFWIFGGGFNLGSSYMYSIYDARHITRHHDVIVVTSNHRLGPLGFFAGDTKQGKIKGNMAIQDQVMALEWVNKNIANFGGDPSNVAIAGLSSGAQSVLIHLVSPKTPAHLFQKAILMSAPFGHYSRSTAEMNAVSRKWADNMGCIKKDKADKTRPAQVDLECLQALPKRDIAKSQKGHEDEFDPNNHAPRAATTHFTWWPHVDGEILTEEPLDLVLKGSFKKVPILMGDARNEIGWYTKFMSVPHSDTLTSVLHLRDFFKQKSMEEQRLRLFHKENVPLLQQYYPSTTSEKDNELRAVQLVTDAAFRCPMIQMGDLLAKENKEVYMYQVEKPADFMPLGRCSTDMVCHAFDLAYLWRPSFLWFSDAEKKMSNQYVSYFVNFMYGDINRKNTDPIHHGKHKHALAAWPKYTLDTKNYMKIKPECSLGQNLAQKECENVWFKIGYKF
jgi:carboxylesterase type B